MGKRVAVELKSTAFSFDTFLTFASFVSFAVKLCLPVVCLLVFSLFSTATAQINREGVPLALPVEIVFENSAQDQTVAEPLRRIAQEVVGTSYSAVRNREALGALYESGRVAAAQVQSVETGTPSNRQIKLRFVVRRSLVVERVVVNVAQAADDSDRVTGDELRLRIGLPVPNTIYNERILETARESVRSYLANRGFYNAVVTYEVQPSERETRNNLVFNVVPNAQAKVGAFNLAVAGLDPTQAAEIKRGLKLQTGENFTRRELNEDVARVRRALLEIGFPAANLTEPQTVAANNNSTVNISITGNVGARVNVRFVDTATNEPIEIGKGTQERLLPIVREGSLDPGAIDEGARRLAGKFQEDGYFFAEVTAACGVAPPFAPDDTTTITNNSESACNFLDSADLQNRTVDVTYLVARGRRFRLDDLRLEGTNALTIDDVRAALRSQETNLLSVVPGIGYGRGFTSDNLLREDQNTIERLMNELGYRRAEVTARQGVSPDGETLIITFVVREGPLTKVSGVEITGNVALTDDQLRNELPELRDRPFSRVRTRTGNTRLLNLYAREGYIDARATFSIVEQPAPNANEEAVKIVYTVEQEGAKTFINRVIAVGNPGANTKEASILETVAIRPGDLLRADRLTESERNLYATDVFRQLQFTTEPVVTRPDGTAERNVFINYEENPPRIISYGGGFSTDDGPLGFFDIRHVNLFGRLYTGGARIRASRRQQQVRLDFTNPRFIPDGNRRFAPLTISAQYLRDTGVTRFFRSTLDRGALGIVQRLDEEGNPVDEFGARTRVPSINRATITAETSRTLDLNSRSVLFVRYRYEDVRLLDTRSLLVAPLLEPDRKIRLSGIGATLARDTRQNCNNKRSLLERIRTGVDGDPCRYNASNATKGEFLTVDYQLSARQLGGNVSFNRLRATYQRYYQVPFLRGTVFAGRADFGLASLFGVRDRDGNGVIDETDRVLPISERFFSGGSTSLRGFDADEAGPRVVIAPTGVFRNQNNEIITLSPFTVPLGGNALAIVNLEARIPLGSSFQLVPFYDGGNVFRTVGEIFKPRSVADGDIANQNLRTLWSNTVGLGLRLTLPIGGSLAVDYGYLLNPPAFIVPQPSGENAILRLQQPQIHFRFTQAF